MGCFALKHADWEPVLESGDGSCEDPYVGTNLPFILHMRILYVICLEMLIVFGLVFVWKILSLASFGLCPIFKYKVTTKFIGNAPSQKKASTLLSAKSKRFREEIISWKQNRTEKLNEIAKHIQ